MHIFYCLAVGQRSVLRFVYRAIEAKVVVLASAPSPAPPDSLGEFEGHLAGMEKKELSVESNDARRKIAEALQHPSPAVKQIGEDAAKLLSTLDAKFSILSNHAIKEKLDKVYGKLHKIPSFFRESIRNFGRQLTGRTIDAIEAVRLGAINRFAEEFRAKNPDLSSETLLLLEDKKKIASGLVDEGLASFTSDVNKVLGSVKDSENDLQKLRHAYQQLEDFHTKLDDNFLMSPVDEFQATIQAQNIHEKLVLGAEDPMAYVDRVQGLAKSELLLKYYPNASYDLDGELIHGKAEHAYSASGQKKIEAIDALRVDIISKLKKVSGSGPQRVKNAALLVAGYQERLNAIMDSDHDINVAMGYDVKKREQGPNIAQALRRKMGMPVRKTRFNPNYLKVV